MPEGTDTFELRYVGNRFSGGRLPLDALSDLPAFRDLIISLAKEKWLEQHPGRKRVPRGFNQSLLFDLVGIKDRSAAPLMKWNREAAVAESPVLAGEIAILIQEAFNETATLFSNAAVDRFPATLPRDQMAALNKFGAGLSPTERIEFTGQPDSSGNVKFVDFSRRKKLLTRVGETYHKRISGSGILAGTLKLNDAEGQITLDTADLGRISLPVPLDVMVEHYDGYIDAEVQFDVTLILDANDQLRSIHECLDVTIVYASDEQDFRDAMARILEIKDLKEGWLDGDGAPIKMSIIQLTRRVLDKRPDIAGYGLGIFPTEEGGITLEFTNQGWGYVVEFLASGGIELFGVEETRGGTLEPIVFSGMDAKFLAKLDELIGHFEKDG